MNESFDLDIYRLNIDNISNRDIENLLIFGGVTVDDKPKKTDSCPECGSNEFQEDYAKGMIYCNCGQVIEAIFDNGMEKKNYDGDTDEPARCGIAHNKLLPQSSLGTTVNAKGKLKKLHIWNSMPYKERSDNILFKRIHSVCVANGIVKKIEEDSKILCKRVSGTVHKQGKNKGKPIITRGFNRSGIVAGCLFIACRRNDETRSTKEIAMYFGISERDVNKGIRSLLTILDDDSIVRDIGTSKVIHFIQRKCDELRIETRYTSMAKTIANNIDRMSIASNHTTYSLAAATILLTAEMNKLKTITKKKLSKVFCGLSDVTIGKTYKQIKNLKDILIDNVKVDEICKEISKRRNRRIVNQDVWDKMKHFGVDTSKYILEGHEDEMDKDIDINIRPTRYEKIVEEYDYQDYCYVPVRERYRRYIQTQFETKNKSEKVVRFADIVSLSDSEETESFVSSYTDEYSDNSYGDYEFMLNDIRATADDVKDLDKLTEDSMNLINHLNEKMNVLELYLRQWAVDCHAVEDNETYTDPDY